jgi:hypothetical protein
MVGFGEPFVAILFIARKNFFELFQRQTVRVVSSRRGSLRSPRRTAVGGKHGDWFVPACESHRFLLATAHRGAAVEL